jgi:hypothetical protein
MATEASAAEVAYPLFSRRGAVRVVTSDAGKPVPALPLAFALQECFPLAGSSTVRTQLPGVNKVSYIIGEILAREKG